MITCDAENKVQIADIIGGINANETELNRLDDILVEIEKTKYYDFTANAGQAVFTIAGDNFQTAKVYSNGIRIQNDQFMLSIVGANVNIHLNDPATLNEWIAVEPDRS